MSITPYEGLKIQRFKKRGKINYLNGKPLIGYTIEQALTSKYIKQVIVSTDNPEIANLSITLGAKAPFLRYESHSKDFVDIEKVLQYSLGKIEDMKIFPDLIVHLEETFPFRPKYFVDNMIEQAVRNGFDSVLAAKKEYRSVWKEENSKIERIDKGDIPRKYKEPCFIGMKGLGCVTHPEFLRDGSLLGERIGIYEVMAMDEKLHNLIVAKASSEEIKRHCRSSGGLSLRQDGLEKAKAGITTIEEVLRLTPKE